MNESERGVCVLSPDLLSVIRQVEEALLEMSYHPEFIHWDAEDETGFVDTLLVNLFKGLRHLKNTLETKKKDKRKIAPELDTNHELSSGLSTLPLKDGIEFAKTLKSCAESLLTTVQADNHFRDCQTILVCASTILSLIQPNLYPHS